MLKFRGRSTYLFLAGLLAAGIFLCLKALPAEAVGDYSKLFNGTLLYTDWNNLPTDFLNTWQNDATAFALGINTTTVPTSGLLVDGPIYGSYLGLLDAGNISSGEFGANTGGGAYSFPSDLDVDGILNVNGRAINLYGALPLSIGFGNGASMSQNESGFTFGNNSGVWDYALGDLQVSIGDLSVVTGNIVIGNRPATANLHVEGTGYFSSTVSVGTPTSTTHATTKAYVDAAIAAAGDSLWGGEPSGNIWNLNSGNIGIGLSNTSTIPVRLTIEESLDGTALELLRLQNPGTGAAGTRIGFYRGEPSTEQARISAQSNSIQFGLGSAGTEAMRIHTGGNVGIGTNAPSAKLHVKGIANGVQLIIQASSTQSITNPILQLLDSAGNELARVNSDNASNIFLGYLSGNANAYAASGGPGGDYTSHGAYNSFVGSEAGRYNTTGDVNTAFGYLALNDNTTADFNTAIGGSALRYNTGSHNTALGAVALSGNLGYGGVQGSYNTAVGSNSLLDHNAGNGNTAVGYEASRYSVLGEYNTAVGYQSLHENIDGLYNVALGAGALYTTGNSAPLGHAQTGIGYHALYSSAGSNNIALGYQAGDNITTGSNNIIIGYDINAPSATADSQLNIGNVIYGDLASSYIGIATNTPATTLDINGLAKMRNYTITQPEDITNKSYVDSAIATATGTISTLWGGTAGGDIWNENSGGIGIGTNAPNSKLEIRDDLALGDNSVFSIYNNDILRTTLYSTGKQIFYMSDDVDEAGRVDISTPGGHPGFAIYTGATYDQNRFNLYNTGDLFHLGYLADGFTDGGINIIQGNMVGIATATPAATLDIYGLAKMRNYTITQPEDITNKSYVDSAIATATSTLATHTPVTLAAIGGSANANGMTLTGQVLNLQPASASYGGVVTTGTQTLAGAKTFSSLITGSAGLTITGAAVNLNVSSSYQINIGTGTHNRDINIGGGSNTLYINTSDWDISTAGGLTGISGITNDKWYTQSGTDANTFTGATTFSNATYSALFTGGPVGVATATPLAALDINALAKMRNYTITQPEDLVNKSYVDSLGYITSDGTENYLAKFRSGGTVVANSSIYDDGTGVGIGTTSYGAYKLKVSGDVAITGKLATETGSDFAEEFTTSADLAPGMVVVMGDLGHKSVKPAKKNYDSQVVGIVSDNPSIIAGKVDSPHKAIVAMMGVVTVKVCDLNGPIERGDLLTTSRIEGYAMRSSKFKEGTIIGKALEDMAARRGEIKVLVNLQ